MSIAQKLWVEKYRPKELDQMVISEEYRRVFQKWIDQKEIPNTLFVGKAGSGKTTLARILINKVVKDKNSDLLTLNGSSQRGIGVVRDVIEEFLKTIVFGGSKIKVVFIDEFDFMTAEAQNALRNIIETYSDTGRFLLTGNYESKITDAIKSRTPKFVFQELPKETTIQFAENVLKKENVTYDPNVVSKIVMELHPDIRKIIGTLQNRTYDGVLSSDISDLSPNEKLCRSLLTDLINAVSKKEGTVVSSTVYKISQLLQEYELDYMSLYSQILDDENVPYPAKIKITQYLDKHVNCAIPRFNYMAMIYDVIEVMAKRRDL